MDSPREPLPPIVDVRLIEAPFEVAVLGQTYVETADNSQPDLSGSSREAKREQRIALKQARREAKMQAKMQAKVDARLAKRPSPDTVDVELSGASSESISSGIGAVPTSRSFSFDDLIDGATQ